MVAKKLQKGSFGTKHTLIACMLALYAAKLQPLYEVKSHNEISNWITFNYVAYCIKYLA